VVTAVNQGNNNYVVAGKVDSFGDTLSDPRRFDSTGMFHWCAPQQLSSVIIVSCSSFQLLVITDIGADFSFLFLGAKDELLSSYDCCSLLDRICQSVCRSVHLSISHKWVFY